MACKPKPVSIDTKLQALGEVAKTVKSNTQIAKTNMVSETRNIFASCLPLMAKYQAINIIKQGYFNQISLMRR